VNRILVVCALALAVAACGGGGSSSTTPAPVADTGPVTGVATPTSVSVVTATQ